MTSKSRSKRLSPVRLLLAALVTAAACVTGLIGIHPALAGPVTDPMPDVVLGNLGASGTNALNLSSSHTMTNDIRMAMSFVTGSDGPWQVSGLRLGIGNPSSNSAPYAFITSDDAGNPDPASPVAMYTLAEGGSITSAGLYDFSLVFGGALQASTNYWLFVGEDYPSSSFDWYDNAAEAAAVAQNASGWSFGATKVSLDGGSTWAAYGAGSIAAFSVAAVPEPSSACIALAGLACGGYGMWRRRNRACRHDG
jgi:hypothetical protein